MYLLILRSRKYVTVIFMLTVNTATVNGSLAVHDTTNSIRKLRVGW